MGQCFKTTRKHMPCKKYNRRWTKCEHRVEVQGMTGQMHHEGNRHRRSHQGHTHLFTQRPEACLVQGQQLQRRQSRAPDAATQLRGRGDADGSYQANHGVTVHSNQPLTITKHPSGHMRQCATCGQPHITATQNSGSHVLCTRERLRSTQMSRAELHPKDMYPTLASHTSAASGATSPSDVRTQCSSSCTAVSTAAVQRTIGQRDRCHLLDHIWMSKTLTLFDHRQRLCSPLQCKILAAAVEGAASEAHATSDIPTHSHPMKFLQGGSPPLRP